MGARRERARAMAGATIAAATLALTAPAVADAQAAVNTWDGICEEVPGEASWPEQPLGMTTVDTLLVADLAGGTCDGELNGVRIDDEPVEFVHFDYRGPQSCVAGSIEGPARFRLGGVDFHGHATYRRVGIHVRVEIVGDRGGSVNALVRGAGAGGSIGTWEALEGFATGCAGSGVRHAYIVVVRSVAVGFASSVDAG